MLRWKLLLLTLMNKFAETDIELWKKDISWFKALHLVKFTSNKLLCQIKLFPGKHIFSQRVISLATWIKSYLSCNQIKIYFPCNWVQNSVSFQVCLDWPWSMTVRWILNINTELCMSTLTQYVPFFFKLYTLLSFTFFFYKLNSQ
jgi:hypothetical protein